jgi:hypothetical protein
LAITVTQRDIHVAGDINHDKAIWSGLSWAVVEVPAERLAPGEPVTIRFESREPAPVKLTAELHLVSYT